MLDTTSDASNQSAGLAARSRQDMGLRVICYAGYRGEQEPQEFFLGDRAVQVVEIIDRWASPGHRYFKCRGSDGDTYILRHDVVVDRWELTMFAKG